MTIEQNKAIVRRLWEEVWNQNDLAVCDETFDTKMLTMNVPLCQSCAAHAQISIFP